MKKYGEISIINLVAEKGCGFVTFIRREDAEQAIKELSGHLVIQGTKLNINWSKTSATTSNQNHCF